MRHNLRALWARRVAGPALIGLLLQPFAFLAPASAAIRMEEGDSVGRARLVAPAAGERLVASAVRFAYELPRDVDHAWLLVSREPFEPAGWQKLPDDPGILRIDIDATGTLPSLDRIGISPAAETPLYWAVASTDRARGRLEVSDVRSFTALPRFANRVMASQFLGVSREGRLGEEPQAVSPRIRLSAGYDFAPSEGEPALPAGLATARLPIDDAGGMALGAYLVQFQGDPSDEERAAIAKAGGAVFAYVPDQAYLVRMSAEARARLSGEARVAWIGDYAPAFKLSPMLAAPGLPRTGAFMALLFPDADMAKTTAALAASGCTIENQSDNGINRLVRFRASDATLASVAGLSEVAWVEPVVQKTMENDLAQWVVQTNVANDRRVWTMGIRGQGQIVNTSDSGIDVTHDQFRDPAVPMLDFGDYPTHRKIVAYKPGGTSGVSFGDHAGASFHGTHTACTLMGSDDATANASARDGMAKDARIYFMDISGPAIGNTVSPFDDLNDVFTPPYLGNAAGAARISSNSWGAGVNGVYDLSAMQVDQFMWNHPDFYISFSNGNSGIGGSVGSPATAKNSAGVGGTRNGASANLIYTQTSRGPTLDGRRKPTFCSPGQTVNSAQSGPANYAALSGTSMASPSATGAVTLMRQYLVDGWYPTGAPVPANGFSPSAALLKAMAINSADNGVPAFTAPDFNIGYGRIKADNVLFFPGDTQKLLLVDNTAGLGNGQFLEYQVNVVDGTAPFEVSLCWTDFPSNPTAATQLVNNLDLTVSQGATVYKGNVFSAGNSATGGSYDLLNVEENVRVAAPPTGIWTVRVAAPSVPIGPQGFGLVITGGVGNGAGALALDRAEYGSTSTVDIEVIDTNAVPPVTVDIFSTTEPGGETIILTGSNGVWTGSLPLAPTNPVAANDILSVSHGDALTATYDDAAPLTTLIASATVSLATPVITNVHATSQGTAGTLVTWNTDRNATSRVYYGLTPALEIGSVTGSGAPLAHQVLLPNLTPGPTYYYDVEATALNGNASRDDKGGQHYRFTAKSSRDILLVLGEAGFPRLATYQAALAAKNYDFDVWSGPLADNPLLGDRNTGLRSYRGVLWQCGFDNYPPVTDVQRQAITDYMTGGGRLAIMGHDLGWGLADPASPAFNPIRAAWVGSTLKATYQTDPPTWAVQFGIAADPISGAYVGGIGYEPIRAGGAGDEVDLAPAPGGPSSYVWRNADGTPDDDAVRWENGAASGSSATALWGGAPSRIVSMFFEWTSLDPPFNAPSPFRTDVLDKTLIWLFGRDRPAVAVTSPNGGEVLVGSNTNITWTESIGGGLSASARRVEYSIDAGDSWVVLTTSAGPSPYLWDLTTVPNSASCLVRVRVEDNGTPATLAQGDASNSLFTIARAGGDSGGPMIVAGSIASAPNPIVRPNAASLTATVSDAITGASGVAAAEWSIGPSPAAAGSGTPMNGTFGGNTVAVNISIDTTPFNVGLAKLWVRGRDNAGNWGVAKALDVQVNGPDPVGTGAIPAVAFLSQNAPNPFAGGTTIRFGVPKEGQVELGIYTVQGQLLKRLVSGVMTAGEHAALWDGRNEAGARVPAGVYFYSLRTGSAKLDRRLIALE